MLTQAADAIPDLVKGQRIERHVIVQGHGKGRESAYGTITPIVFMDTEGETYCWWASSDPDKWSVGWAGVVRATVVRVGKAKEGKPRIITIGRVLKR